MSIKCKWLNTLKIKEIVQIRAWYLFFYLCATLAVLRLTCVDDFVPLQVADAVEDPSAHVTRMNVSVKKGMAFNFPAKKNLKYFKSQSLCLTSALQDRAGGLGGWPGERCTWPSEQNGGCTLCSCNLFPYACPLCVSGSPDPWRMSPDEGSWKVEEREWMFMINK